MRIKLFTCGLLFFLALGIASAAQENNVEKKASGTPVVSSEAESTEEVKVLADTEKLKSASKKKKGRFGPGVTKIEDGQEMTSLGVSSWKVFAAIVVMIVSLGGFYLFLKKYGHKFGAAPPGKAMTVISKVQLDGKNSIALVKIYEEEILLGVGGQGVTVLTKYASLDEVPEDAGLQEDDKEPDNDVGKADSGKSFDKAIAEAVDENGDFKKARDIR